MDSATADGCPKPLDCRLDLMVGKVELVVVSSLGLVDNKAIVRSLEL